MAIMRHMGMAIIAGIFAAVVAPAAQAALVIVEADTPTGEFPDTMPVAGGDGIFTASDDEVTITGTASGQDRADYIGITGLTPGDYLLSYSVVGGSVAMNVFDVFTGSTPGSIFDDVFSNGIAEMTQITIAGDLFFRLTTQEGELGNYMISLQRISEVPIPGAVLLFAIGLAALRGAGRREKI